MAGLTREGFTPLSYTELVARISNRLKVFSPGIDLSVESPDGQLTHIFSLELSQVWNELGLVYNSYNPNVAVGDGLRNIGMISGLPYGAATRSQTMVNLVGAAGTEIPVNSIVTDAVGNEFITQFKATIPARVQVVARLSGPITMDIGTIKTIKTPVTGWTSVTQTTAGRTGAAAQTEVTFRNLRNKTVLRNAVAVSDVLRARLSEDLGIEQVNIVNNDHSTNTAPDGTPPQTIHVTLGELPSHITDAHIAQTILKAKGLGCPTFGSTTVTTNDSQGNPHQVSFSKAVAVTVFIKLNVTFLSEDYAGAKEAITSDLVTHINSLATGEDVVWSRLFGVITKHAKAQINSLTLSSDGHTYSAGNLIIGKDKFANTSASTILVTVTN